VSVDIKGSDTVVTDGGDLSDVDCNTVGVSVVEEDSILDEASDRVTVEATAPVPDIATEPVPDNENELVPGETTTWVPDEAVPDEATASVSAEANK